MNDKKYNEQPKINNKKVLNLLLVAVASTGLLSLGYFYGKFAESPNNQDVTHINNKEAIVDEQPEDYTTAEGSYEFSEYSYKLKVPENLEVISLTESSDYADLLTDSPTDEVANWIIGNPSIYPGATGSVSIIRISEKWLDATGQNAGKFSHLRGFNGFLIPSLDFSSPSTKKESIKRIEQETNDCTINNKKGFVIADVIKVCYGLIVKPQAYADYSPQLHFDGYGIINNEQYLLVASFDVSDKQNYSEEEANKYLEEYTSGKTPDVTQDIIDQYIDMLKRTQIEPRNSIKN